MNSTEPSSEVDSFLLIFNFLIVGIPDRNTTHDKQIRNIIGIVQTSKFMDMSFRCSAYATKSLENKNRIENWRRSNATRVARFTARPDTRTVTIQSEKITASRGDAIFFFADRFGDFSKSATTESHRSHNSTKIQLSLFVRLFQVLFAIWQNGHEHVS